MINKPGGAAPKAPGGAEAAKKKQKPHGRLECQLGVVLGAGGLIGSRLGRLWIAFDVFSQFTLQFVIVTFAFAVGYFMPRARLLTAFLIIIAGLVAIGFWSHLMSQSPASVSVAAEGERDIRIATFNTWYSNRNADAVASEIARLDADVIALMELGLDKKPALEKLKGQYPHQVTCFAIDYCNLAILSKFPIVESEARVGWEGPPMILAKLGPELGGLTVIGVHTIRFPHSRAQFRQVTALSKLIESLPGLKLVMGDFNATPFSRIVATIVSRSGLKRLTNLPTWPSTAGLPQVAIDHIFASPAIRATQSQQIGQPAGSDHFPITMRLAIPVPP